MVEQDKRLLIISELARISVTEHATKTMLQKLLACLENYRDTNSLVCAYLPFLQIITDLISLSVEGVRLKENSQSAQVLSEANHLNTQVHHFVCRESRGEHLGGEPNGRGYTSPFPWGSLSQELAQQKEMQHE